MKNKRENNRESSGIGGLFKRFLAEAKFLTNDYLTSLNNPQTMCRKTSLISAACGHVGPNDTLSFFCSDRPHCGPVRETASEINGFCLDCLQNPARLQLIAPNILRQASRVRRVLNLAAAPDSRYRVFEFPTEGRGYMYDSDNLEEFSGRLTDFEGEWLSTVADHIAWYMINSATQGLRPNEFKLVRQIRRAVTTFVLTKRESEIQRQEGANARALIARLRTKLEPAPVPEQNPNCPICLEPMSQLQEGEASTPTSAQRLPCGHIVCKECIEIWVSKWVPGYPFSVCPLCRANFDLLVGRELADGIDAMNLDAQPPAGIWLDVLRAAWSAVLVEGSTW